MARILLCSILLSALRLTSAGPSSPSPNSPSPSPSPSGPAPDCPILGYYAFDWANDLQGVSTRNSVTECATLCSDDGDCELWNYFSNGTCHLLTRGGRTEGSGSGAKSGSGSGDGQELAPVTVSHGDAVSGVFECIPSSFPGIHIHIHSAHCL